MHSGCVARSYNACVNTWNRIYYDLSRDDTGDVRCLWNRLTPIQRLDPFGEHFGLRSRAIAVGVLDQPCQEVIRPVRMVSVKLINLPLVVFNRGGHHLHRTLDSPRKWVQDFSDSADANGSEIVVSGGGKKPRTLTA